MNHQFLDMLSSRLSNFEVAHDFDKDYDFAIDRLRRRIASLYQRDNDNLDISEIRRLMNAEPIRHILVGLRAVPIYDHTYMWQYMSWYKRRELRKLVDDTEHDYYDRAYRSYSYGSEGEPYYTGHKRKWRKPREPRLDRNDYRPYRNNLSYCWKDQSKRRRQYRPVEM